jgi:hypothetical protein
MYTELFKLCGFEADEIERQRPRIDKAFNILGIEGEDIKHAEERVREYFDIELEGVRKLLGIWLKELLAVVLAGEENKKVVYSDWPMPGAPLQAAILASEDVYVGMPAQVLNLTLGRIFDRLSPVLEAGEESGLPPGSAHCALWQTHVGAIVKGIVPRPDLIISPGYYCDVPAEADQLLHELYGIPVAYVDACVDANWDDWPEVSPRRTKYFAGQIRKALRMFAEVTGCEVTEEILRSGVRENAKLRMNFQALQEACMGSDPIPISQVDLALISWMTNTAFRYRDEANEAIIILLKELKRRIEEGKGVVEKGAPRIVFGIQVAVDPSVLRMVERAGLAIPDCFNNWLTSYDLVRPKSTDLAERAAEGWLRTGPIHSARGRTDNYLEKCQVWNVDGFISCYPYSCRLAGLAQPVLKKTISEKLGIPVLILEGDLYDSRNYSAEQLRTRVESFAEMLKMAKAAKRA